jgi:LemA protein
MLYVIIALLLILIILSIYEYNIIKKLQNKVAQSKSGIDVALKMRFDLIPNLIECVKGYCSHEEKVLTEVTKEREAYYKTNNLSDGMNLSKKCNQVLALAEQYPELKANSQFLDLQTSLAKTENQIAAARRLYNSDCNMYNTKIETFPGNIYASIMNAKKEELFEIEDAAQKENVKVKF